MYIYIRMYTKIHMYIYIYMYMYAFMYIDLLCLPHVVVSRCVYESG